MKRVLYEYEDYKEYLNDWLLAQPKKGHGWKSRLAAGTGCNSTYVTQVLNSGAHFSAEQLEKASRLIGHTQEETLFFLLLLQFTRAGTPELKALIRTQMSQAIEHYFNFKNRLGIERKIEAREQANYYSAWYFSAIHVALGIPSLQTKPALAKYFNLPLKLVSDVLQFLLQAGLANEEKGLYLTGPISLHLSRESPLILKHHSNWRIKSLHSIEKEKKEDMHYSSAVSISATDQPRIRQIFLNAIEEVRSVIKTSPEEAVYCYSIDFFCLEEKID